MSLDTAPRPPATRLLRAGGALGVLLLAAGCGAQEPERAATPTTSPAASGEAARPGEVEDPRPRLVVTDRANGAVKVLDLASGRPVGRFDAGAPSTPAVAADGRHVLLAQQDARRVRALDAGAWSETHGDHAHHYAAAPRLRGGATSDEPSHVVTEGSATAIFADGDGTASVLDPEALDAGRIAGRTVASGRPHHGVAVPVGERTVITAKAPGQAEEDLPSLLSVRGADGQETQRVDDCPGVHGEAARDDLVAFGCEDAVVVLRERDGERFGVTRIPYGDDLPRDTRVYGVHAPEDADHLVVDADGIEDGVKRAVAAVDPTTRAIRSVDVPADYSYDFDVTDDGRAVIADAEGRVHLVDPVRKRVVASLDDATAGYDPDDEDAPLPAVTVSGGRAYVSDPRAGRVVELDLEDGLRPTRRFALGGAPGASVAVGD